MLATLRLTHKAIGVEVRRGPYDVVVDGERVGAVNERHVRDVSRAWTSPPALRADHRRDRLLSWHG